jgi:hypothetical protein
MRSTVTLWRNILRDVRPVFGLSAVIAGGCIRDYALGIPCKDIDVFVDSRDLSDFCNKLARLMVHTDFASLDHINYRDKLSDSEYEQWDNGEGELIGCAEGYYLFDGERHLINIVARRDLAQGPDALISRFDMGIVQAYFDGERRVYSDAFKTDYANSTATLMRADTRDLSFKRYQRFDARHPNLLDWVE